MPQKLIHASCVAINGKGVLLTGVSGSGKSSIALELIDRGAELVADDQTLLFIENNLLLAKAPVSIAGLMEIRNVGLLKMPYCSSAEIALCIELITEAEKAQRLPESEEISLLGKPIRFFRLPSRESVTPAKIRAALLYEDAGAKTIKAVCNEK